MAIHLIGPGGAGKSTAAPLVAALLACPSVDLDRAFEAAHGDIDQFISERGYIAYASANVETYLAHRSQSPVVIALSSGFMLYPDHVFRGVRELQHGIAAASTTVLLLPSLDLETCVAETVRRQATRNLAIRRSAAREEAVIRERFAYYRPLTDSVATTMQSPERVARDILDRVGRAYHVWDAAPQSI